MTEIILSMLIGYLLGSLSPAALISTVKKKNLKENGTGNLGATNTMLVFGKGYGVCVMIIDMLKAFVSVKLAELLFPKLFIAGLLAGCCTVIGHIFPVYLKFRGGKGLAAFGGMILAFNPYIFLIIAVLGIVLIFITNYGVALPVSAAVSAPVLAGIIYNSPVVAAVLAAVGILLIFKHKENFAKIRNGTEIRVREFIKNHFNKSQKGVKL